MTNKTSEHANDDYKVTMVQEPGCVVRYTIVVTPKATEASHRKAVKLINKEVSLPGFRKGKAPTEIIQKQYSSHIEKEWKDVLLQTAFNAAMKLTNVYPLNKESVKNVKINSHSLEEGSVVEVLFESMPEIPEIDLKSLTIPHVEIEPVTQTKIDQIVEDIRYRFAEWEEVQGRPVEKNDFVDVDIENLEAPGEFLCEDTRIEVAEGKLGKWLLDLLLGMNVGDSREATSQQDEGQNVEHFKPTRCKVTVKSIQKSTLPEVNDAFAEKAGLSSIDELYERVKADLAKIHKNAATEKERNLLEEAILAKYSFEVPESLVTNRAQQMMDKQRAELAEKMKNDASLEAKLKELEDDIFKKVKDSYRWYFIVHKTADENNIDVDQNEVFTEILRKKYMDPNNSFEMDPDSMKDLFAHVSSMMLSTKVCDFFIEQSSNENGKSS